MGNSVDKLLSDIRNGSSTASEEVYFRFADRLRRFVSSRLDRRLNAKLSPNDIVQSVFRSFFRRNKRGEFSFNDWNGLWALLVTIAGRKCYRSHARFSFAKRDFRLEIPISGNGTAPSEMYSTEPTPDELVELEDTLEWLFSNMDDLQQQVVLLKLANVSSAEIGELVGRTERTVRRILERFRERLEKQIEPS